MELKTRNVNTAFKTLVEMFSRKDHGSAIPLRKTTSRNGNVLMIDEPVLITYMNPRERVLFNTARDANPFFHLYEALWMLAGRNDVESVAYYAKQMREYSDDGKTLNGAYGKRWRRANHEKYQQVYDGDATRAEVWETSVDQLQILVSHLKSNPTSRRAVLSMWNVEDDLLMIDTSKDVCCNLSVMFSIREGEVIEDEAKSHPHTGTFYTTKKYLDMTVTNRSNDMIWGLLGANYVHFTFLQEYIAANLGVGVGRYYHFTNNLHVYEWNWKPKEWLESGDVASYTPTSGAEEIVKNTVPLIKDPFTFEEELRFIVQFYKGVGVHRTWKEPFFGKVAFPMLMAHLNYREYRDDPQRAYDWMELVEADDWRIAGTDWLDRRAK